MRQIEFYKPALRFLETVPAKHGRQILAKIDDLAWAEDPPPDAKRLAGYPFWRARAGDYRIVYDFSPDTLFVVIIGKRNDDEIYRQVRQIVGWGCRIQAWTRRPCHEEPSGQEPRSTR